MEASAQTPAVSMSRIGHKAPASKAVTTRGKISFPEQCSGSRVILSSHLADFTPVCTSESMTFASLEGQSAKANRRLVGFSVDGRNGHIAWLRAITDKTEHKAMRNVEVKLPLIEDITVEVAKRYGMTGPGESPTKAVCAVFVIDPKRTIRTIIYCALSLGRSFDELYRVLLALQTADAFSVATPTYWRPGDDVIVPTSGSCGVAKERMENRQDVTCDRWLAT
jgi:peroxiredoxin 2/4